ncbi:MAG: M14 family zinc carboxypeptidase [Planctomycetota bacterium]
MKAPRTVAAALLAAATSLAQATPPAPARAVYTLDNPTPGQWLQIQQHFDTLDTCHPTAIPPAKAAFLVEPGQSALAHSLLPNATYKRDAQSFQETYSQMLAASGIDVPPTAYYTVAEIEAAIDNEVALYPALAQKVDISSLPGGMQTHEGRPIYALKVSDNVSADEDEPAIVVIAQHHARELNSPHMVIGAMQRLLAAYATDPALQAVVDDYEVWFVPMVNPDGVDYVWNADEFWRKNRRDNGGGTFGVDLNRNYPFLYGQCGSSTSPTSGTYRGPSAASEPETVSMRNLIERLRPEIYIDFHSSGQEVLRTYAPCATTSPMVAGLIERYADDLRAPMNFAKRDPSASGEAPEDHWASGGTLSYLIEIGTSFQPDFSLTIAEEARVWPGVEHALTSWRPAVRGHVTSSTAGGSPLAADITYTPNVFQLGEANKSRARDGRYGMWLPLGSWNVTFSAPGYISTTVPVNVTSYDTPIVQDIVLVPDAYATFGQGCPGSVPAAPQPCPELNPAGGALNQQQRDNEYCFRVTQSDPLTVQSFDIWTAAIGGSAVTVTAHIYEDVNGSPSPTALASTSVLVDTAEAFYTATFSTPVSVTGDFYVGFDTSAETIYISTLQSGNSGVGFYRDLVNGPNNWTQSGLVQNPSWRISCQGPTSTLTPAISFVGTPNLGATYEPAVSDALPVTFAVLASGLDDQIFQGSPLPLALPNAPGCDLLVAADVLDLAITDANGNAQSPITVPSTGSLVGLEVFHQWLIWDPTVNVLNIVSSNAGFATVQN